MEVKTQILGKYNDNSLAVKIQAGKKQLPRMYKVPIRSLDSFVSDYKKNQKRSAVVTNAIFFGAVFGGTIFAGRCFSSVQNQFAKLLIGVLGGMIAGVASTFASNKCMKKSHDSLLAKYSVNEIYQS